MWSLDHVEPTLKYHPCLTGALTCPRYPGQGKGPRGITGLSRPRVHIDDAVWHLDVDSSHPGAEVGPKGSAVRRLKRYESWVQNVVRQFGPYLLWAQEA